MPEIQYRIVVVGVFGREVLAYAWNEYRAMRVANALCEVPLYSRVTVEDIYTDEEIFIGERG